MFQFEKWAKIKFFCKQGKSAIANLAGLGVVYIDKSLKNPLCTTGTTNFLFTTNYA
jgi:hypothetical protein